MIYDRQCRGISRRRLIEMNWCVLTVVVSGMSLLHYYHSLLVVVGRVYIVIP